ncbi:MAG: class I SAM-dependent methyltransferase [bacterium]
MTTTCPEVTEIPDLPINNDLFGQILIDCHNNGEAEFIYRRDDGYSDRVKSSIFLAPRSALPTHHRCLINHAVAPILDIAAGAGRHALALQESGLQVTAIDSSAGAVEVMKKRGVADARQMSINNLDFPSESFNTIMLMGNTLGLATSIVGLNDLLSHFYKLITDDGQVLLEICDYSATRNPLHLQYHEHNRQIGRYPGVITIREEYNSMCAPWINLLYISLPDLRAACAKTNWRIKRCVQTNSDGIFAIGLEKL